MIRLVARAARRWQDVLWAAAIVGLLVWRWPILKGYYYRLAHVEAPATSIPWRTDLTAALAEAKRTGRPVLVDFNASWCPPCLAMAHDTWTDARVAQAIASGVVPVQIDIDRDPTTSDRYGVESIPTVLLLDADARVLKRAGFLPASGVLRFISGD